MSEKPINVERLAFNDEGSILSRMRWRPYPPREQGRASIDGFFRALLISVRRSSSVPLKRPYSPRACGERVTLYPQACRRCTAPSIYSGRIAPEGDIMNILSIQSNSLSVLAGVGRGSRGFCMTRRRYTVGQGCVYWLCANSLLPFVRATYRFVRHAP